MSNIIIDEHDERLWHQTDLRTENYSQMVVIPACVVAKEDEADINSYVRSAIPAMNHDLIMVGAVKTTDEMPNGEMRIDGMMLIHDEDIPFFAHKRFLLDLPLRWLEDVLGNQMERGTQTYADAFLRDYPPTWTYGDTQWHEYECYEGTWRVLGA